MTPAAVPPSQEAIIRSLEGPFITSAEMPVSLAWWDQKYTERWDILWDHPDYSTATASNLLGDFVADGGKAWDAPSNTARYEPDAREYVQWVRFGGDVTHFNRARLLAADYRDRYLIPNGYGPVVNYMALHGLTLDWLLNGDTSSRDTVVNTAERMLPVLQDYVLEFTNTDIEPRIWARTLDTAWMWEIINGTPMVRSDNGQAHIDYLIPLLLAQQNASGYWALPSYCNLSDNWIQAHFLDHLIQIHDNRPGSYNASIQAAATAFANFVWSTQWTGSPTFAFPLISGFCSGVGDANPTRDLNGFYLPLFGWLGKHVDPVWWDRADFVLTGLNDYAFDIRSDGLYNSNFPVYKQFTEVYSYTYRYFGYRYGS